MLSRSVLCAPQAQEYWLLRAWWARKVAFTYSYAVWGQQHGLVGSSTVSLQCPDIEAFNPTGASDSL